MVLANPVYVTVYLVIFLPEIPYIHRMYMYIYVYIWFWPTLVWSLNDQE
jgi:hypothetical protein